MTMEQQLFIPYGRQTITDADIAAVTDILRSPFLTQGPAVPTFEQAVASKVGALHGVAVNSATSALHIACLSLGLGPGDRLWTSPITFVASANCGLYCGADVDFVDIDPLTGLMSVEALTSKLEMAERNGLLPKVLIPVHLSGTSCDMKSIARLAKRYQFSVIEDASHAIGGYYDGTPVGSCNYSDITVFSFHPVKIITTAEGGLATTNNAILAKRMSNLRSHGITKNPQDFKYPSKGLWSYEQQELGYNYRMSDIHAALGLSQLNRLESIVDIRNTKLRSYAHRLRDLPLNFLAIPSNVLSSVHLAVMRLKEHSISRHSQVFSQLRDAGIGVQLHYTPVHLQPYYRSLGFMETQFPESEKYATSAISLPLFPDLTADQQEFVCRTLESLIDD